MALYVAASGLGGYSKFSDLAVTAGDRLSHPWRPAVNYGSLHFNLKTFS